jgi:hypothetical protein
MSQQRSASLMAEHDLPNVIVSLASSESGEDPLVVALPQLLEIVSTGVVTEVTLLEQYGSTATLATKQVGIGSGAIPFHVSGGPRLDAYRQRAACRIDSTAMDDRWPEFCRDATAAGVQSVLSLPLITSGDGIGALSFYSPTAFCFELRDELAGSLFAALVSPILAHALRG